MERLKVIQNGWPVFSPPSNLGAETPFVFLSEEKKWRLLLNYVKPLRLPKLKLLD